MNQMSYTHDQRDFANVKRASIRYMEFVCNVTTPQFMIQSFKNASKNAVLRSNIHLKPTNAFVLKDSIKWMECALFATGALNTIQSTKDVFLFDVLAIKLKLMGFVELALLEPFIMLRNKNVFLCANLLKFMKTENAYALMDMLKT